MKKRDQRIINLLDSKKVAAVRVGKHKSRWADKSAEYILLSDKKTIIVLEKQDYETYHDCDTSARSIRVYQDKNDWKRRMDDEYFEDALTLT